MYPVAVPLWGIIWAGGSGTQWERVGDKQAAAATLDCPGGLCLPAWEDGDDRLSISMF